MEKNNNPQQGRHHNRNNLCATICRLTNNPINRRIRTYRAIWVVKSSHKIRAAQRRRNLPRSAQRSRANRNALSPTESNPASNKHYRNKTASSHVSNHNAPNHNNRNAMHSLRNSSTVSRSKTESNRNVLLSLLSSNHSSTASRPASNRHNRNKTESNPASNKHLSSTITPE